MTSENNSKLRFGIIGTNFISDWIIAGAKQDERFEAIAVYSRRQETADAFATKHQIPHTFTSLETMAKSDLIDAVYIASPNFLHAEQSILFMQHGKHVLCEKPLASNACEAKAMIAASKLHRVTLMEAMKPTLTPNFSVVQEHLYRVGEIRHYFSAFCQYSSRYEKFKAGIPVNAFDPALSNGAIMDIGVYTIYPMVVLFGRPLQIKAQGQLLSSGVDGMGTVCFDYGKMTATIVYSKISDSVLPTEIQGENGNIVLDRISIIKKVEFVPRQPPALGKGMPAIPENISLNFDKDEYYYEIKEFIDLVLAGKTESLINSHENSVITLEIIDEIRRQMGVIFPADGKE
ncbi:MAG: Gfo/Idh/MocA family oxidoreductase [Paludibacter sp.]|nr:Gfo/Idh/MocA family oxidoreductase [Paludibacter sp.]